MGDPPVAANPSGNDATPVGDIGAADTTATAMGGSENDGVQNAASGGMATAGAGGSGSTAAGAPANQAMAGRANLGPSAMGGAGGTPTAGGAIGGEAAVGGASVVDNPADGSGEPTFHIFLLLGQSNMAGYPKAQDADRVEDPRIQVLGFDDCDITGRQTDQWDIAAPPLHECWNDGLGIGDYFAKTLIEVVPEGDTIGLVPCALSGEPIETFMKAGGTQYDWILGRARMAQDAGGVIQGLLFHQGESNSGDSAWPGNVNTFITDLRADLNIGEAPFLAGELLYSGSTSGHNTQVNRLPEVMSNTYVISAEGLVVDPADAQWMLHFDHDSVITFGQRYAETMISALGW